MFNKNIIKYNFKLKKKILKFVNSFIKYHFNYNTIKLHINYGKSLLKMLPGYINSFIYYNREFYIIIKKSYNLIIINFLKKYTNGLFNVLSDLCAVDYPKNIYRFEIIYTLLSIFYNSKIKIKTYIMEFDNINSIVNNYLCANWLEREIYDFFGIIFKNNIDLRRILTNYGFKGYPLRKDFSCNGYTELSFSLSKNKLVYKNCSDYYVKKKK